MTFKCVDLAEIHNSILGLSKGIEWIFIYGICFALFLVVECKNSIENISISMSGMVFSSIKSWAGRGLNQYFTKSLKIHESLTKCLIIKNYNIFGKKKSGKLKYILKY